MSPEHEKGITGSVLNVLFPTLLVSHTHLEEGGRGPRTLREQLCLLPPKPDGAAGVLGLCATLENSSPSWAGRKERSGQAWRQGALARPHDPRGRQGQAHPYPCAHVGEAQETGNCGLALMPGL